MKYLISIFISSTVFGILGTLKINFQMLVLVVGWTTAAIVGLILILKTPAIQNKLAVSKEFRNIKAEAIAADKLLKWVDKKEKKNRKKDLKKEEEDVSKE